jgi:subfamily B ATP-binding cassette protein MsbA
MFGSPSYRRFLHFVRPYWPQATGSIVAGVFKFSLALSLPIALKFVFDGVLDPKLNLTPEEQYRRLGLIMGVLVLCFVGRAPATYLRSYLAQVAGNRTIFDLRRELYRHLQRLGHSYHINTRTGNSTSRLINDLNAAQGILDQGVIAIAMDCIFLVGVVVFLFVYNIILTGDCNLALASLLLLPGYALLFRLVNPRLRVVATQVQEEMEEMSGEATEKLSGMPVVLAFVREKTEELSFFRRNRRYYNQVMRRVRLRLALQTTAEFLTAVGPIVVICYGGYLVIAGSLSFGNLLLFNGFLAHLYLPTRRLADYSALLQERLAAIDRVFEVLDSAPEVSDADTAAIMQRPDGRVEFDGVRFAYDDEQDVLSNVSFTVEPGEAVAIVGRSGAGKSTMANLVPRFYDATEGAVRIDGIDVRDVTLRSLRENVGMVLQDTILFSGTIRENILYGRINASEAEMLKAAQMAHVHEFVEQLSDRYDTVIGERGLTLSGGQKQRLSIARAFLRDPRILILDEATSSLDSGAELIIQDALRKLMRGRTTLVIAHRLSTIVDCDSVLVLQDGRIVQRGPHRDLIHEQGPYRTFCKEQFGNVELEGLDSRRAG